MHELEEAASGLTPKLAASGSTVSKPFGAGPPHPPAAASSSDGHATSSSTPMAFATLQWQALHTEALVKSAKLDYMKIWLQEACILRAAPAPGRQTPRHQQTTAASASELQDVFRLQAAYGIEHSALQGSQGQNLACHVQWRPQQGGVGEHQVSVHVGSITAVHVPGLITSLFTFAGLASPAAQDISEPPLPKAFKAQQASSVALPAEQASVESASPALRSGLSVSVSVLGIGIGALSSAEVDSHAGWLTCSKLSLHLGQIRARGRPGSLAAGLLSLQQGAPPQHGLRVSAVGVQLGLVPHWSGITDASTLWPAGVQEVSEPIEMQALLQGWAALQAPVQPQHDQSAQVNQLPRPCAQMQAPQVGWPAAPSWQAGIRSKPEQPASQRQQSAYAASSVKGSSRLITAASSAVHLNLTGLQLAMLASVAEAIASEISRRFRKPLPPQAISPGNLQDAGKEAWLSLVSIQTAPTYLMLTLDEQLDRVLAKVPSGLRSALAHDADLPGEGSDAFRQTSVPGMVIMCDRFSATMAVGPAGRDLPGVCITLAMPHAWASPDVKACIPACDLHVAAVAMQASEQPSMVSQRPASAVSLSDASASASDSAVSHLRGQQPQLVSVQMLGTPLAVVSSLDAAVASSKADAQAGSRIIVELQSVSLDIDAIHLTKLVQFVQCTMLGPSVPVLPTYPPDTLPSSGRMEVQMQAQMLFGQLQASSMIDPGTRSTAPDLAFWLIAPSFSYSKSTAQVECCSCAPLGC